MPSTVLVTGGCGYIGCKLVPSLLEKGCLVRVLDCLYFGNNLPANIALHPNLSLTTGDIRDNDTVERALEGADAVIHLAAMANDPSAELDTELTKAINLDATLNLLKRSQQTGVSRFVNASTATVYGVREEPDVDETFEHRPISLYGKYKSETDVATASANSDVFIATNLRASTVCGWSPRMRLDLTVNILTEQAKNKGSITVHGGEQKRPNVVIDDLVRAYMTLLEAPAALVGGESFNIGASNRTVLEIAKAVAKAVNPAAEINIEPVHDHRSYHISTRKAETILGFKTAFDVEDGALQVANSIDSGLIPDPSDDCYRNVGTMKALSSA